MNTELTLSERIYQELYDDITEQRLKPGQNLTLNMLKSRFNVSHTPIREALTKLAADGLATYHPNKGMKVIEFSETEIRELFKFSAELEAMAVNMCKDSFTLAPLLNELESIIKEEQAAIENHDNKRWEQVAGQIHDIFYRYSGNRYLREAASRVGARMNLLSNIYSTEETYPAMYERHFNIYQAISEHDFDKASELVKAHLQFNMVYTLNGLYKLDN